MKKISILFALALLMNISAAFAQVVDMRELSRRRKYEAYHAPAPEVVRPKTVQPSYAEKKQSQTKRAASAEKKDRQKTVKAVDQTEEMQQYIANNPRVKPDI